MDLDFIKEVGEALKEANVDSVDEFEQALVDKVKRLRLSVSDLDIQWDKGTATVMGMVPDQATKEKVLLAVGNTKGVAKVKDSLVVGLTASQGRGAPRRRHPHGIEVGRGESRRREGGG
jgi:hypothetical protein